VPCIVPAMDLAEMRHRVGVAPVARLATVDRRGLPHLVPLCLALAKDVIYSAVDQKPKASSRLKRLDNIRAHPQATLLVDHYEDDWSRLWWVRVDGTARVVERGPQWERGVQHLRAKYEQYRAHPPEGPVIVLSPERWTGWAAEEAAAQTEARG
jgi:PPOX class probable F420-dependent enzyme